MIQASASAALGAVAAALLAGCAGETASVAIDGSARALTVSVRRNIPWEREYEVEAVMSALPACQRRSRLEPVPGGEFRLELHRAPDGVYPEPILILRQAARYYAIGLEGCEIQRFAKAPAQLGRPLGAFEFGTGRGRFVPAPAAPAPAGR